jgi:hypothetical protein
LFFNKNLSPFSFDYFCILLSKLNIYWVIPKSTSKAEVVLIKTTIFSLLVRNKNPGYLPINISIQVRTP